MLRLALAQTNFTVGAIEENTQAIKAFTLNAHGQGANVVIFPELALTGYYPGDLLEEASFLSRVEAGLADLQEFSARVPDMHIVLGAPLRNKAAGKPLHNALVVLHKGAIQYEYAKQLLPTYDVFDERRHFEPGFDDATVFEIGGMRVGFVVCEDAWNDDSAGYSKNPLWQLAQHKPDLVVSINASPSERGKRQKRHQLLSRACKKHGFPLVYVNQVGGHDQIVYDGGSFIVDSSGTVVFEAPRFEEAVSYVAFNRNGEKQDFTDFSGTRLFLKHPEGVSEDSFVHDQIVTGLRDYARRCGFSSVVVGSSGGIDSAVTLALAVEALGADNVTAITMPSVFSSEGSVSDSVALCENLGIRLYEVPIAPMVTTFSEGLHNGAQLMPEGLTLENLQARIRGTLLMAWSNTRGSLVLTTGNKSEMAVGYCTLYGDMNGGLGLIGDLYKTEVYRLARFINQKAGRSVIPEAIIEKEPSAELAPGQRDTDSLPPYEVLDEILKLEVEGPTLSSDERMRAVAFLNELTAHPEGARTVARIKKLVFRSEYKRRQAPPVIRIRPRAFGNGRQMPIACAAPL